VPAGPGSMQTLSRVCSAGRAADARSRGLLTVRCRRGQHSTQVCGAERVGAREDTWGAQCCCCAAYDDFGLYSNYCLLTAPLRLL